MLSVQERQLDFHFAASLDQSCQWDNHPFLGQLAPQESTYVPATHHRCDRLDSSP